METLLLIKTHNKRNRFSKRILRQYSEKSFTTKQYWYITIDMNSNSSEIWRFKPAMAREIGAQPQVDSYQKLKKIVLDVTLLSTQHYKVRIKDKVDQFREWSSTLSNNYWKETFVLLSTMAPKLYAMKMGSFSKWSESSRDTKPYNLE